MHMIGAIIAAVAALAAADSPKELTIEAAEAGPAGATRHFQVAAGDLDGDGKADRAILKVRCDQGQVAEAYLAREWGSGMATGKRQHKPITVVKEWDKATPLLAMKAGYDVKKVEGTGARTMAHDDWMPVAMTGASSLCALRVSR